MAAAEGLPKLKIKQPTDLEKGLLEQDFPIEL
jgi:hypothetical protein